MTITPTNKVYAIVKLISCLNNNSKNVNEFKCDNSSSNYLKLDELYDAIASYNDIYNEKKVTLVSVPSLKINDEVILKNNFK